MSANSLFRDLIGERDPIHSQSRTTTSTSSGQYFREWTVFVPDKCSLTRLDVLVGTAAVVGASRQAKLKIAHVPSGTASRTFTAKGYCVVTLTASASYAKKTLFPSSAITLPAGSMVSASIASYPLGLGTPLGVKLAWYFTKGHVQA